MTKTKSAEAPPGDDRSQFPPYGVTVDIVILTMSEGKLHILLVRRGEAPFEGMWAVPGGFKRPAETLDEAARRELVEETGVDAASLLTQFGAYGDPGRDPRMNVVTVAYLAVLRDVGALIAGTDAAEAALTPVSDVRNGERDLARDHGHRPRCRRARARGSPRSRASLLRSSARRSPWPSYGPSTKRSGACSSTPPTSVAPSSRRRAG